MLASARDHYARQQRISAEGLRRARLARFGSLPRLTAVVTAFQLLSARDAVAAVPLMLDEQGIDSGADAAVLPEMVAGVASDGRPLGSLLDLTRANGFSAQRFDRLVLTQFTDSARHATSAAMAVRPHVDRYARLLVPPSCSRCAVLAGRLYKSSEAFQRHPRCDCRHIPSAESVAGDLRTSPQDYFDSLDAAAQDRIFTKAGAQAIRDGADISQVVNARRGMTSAQVGGRRVLATREGTTRRGFAYHAMKTRGAAGVGADYRAAGERYRRTKSVRLMPESIYELAEDRADAQRLLRLYGYIT